MVNKVRQRAPVRGQGIIMKFYTRADGAGFSPVQELKTPLSYGLVMVVKRARGFVSNKQVQRVFNKIYTNESTNRERIRF